MFKFTLRSIIYALFILVFCRYSSAQDEGRPYSQIMEDYRDAYKKGFIEDKRSPLRQDDLKNLDFYVPEERWRLTCECITDTNPKVVDIPTYSGQIKQYKKYGKALCIFHSDTIVLQLYQNVPSGNPLTSQYLFLPFKDDTNGDTTYGGGRYIHLNIRDIKQNYIEIDFNKAYNPWCAYSDGYNCPVPPRENHIQMAVQAGEKNFKGEYKIQKP